MHFGLHGPTGCILTKLDESMSLGGAFSTVDSLGTADRLRDQRATRARGPAIRTSAPGLAGEVGRRDARKARGRELPRSSSPSISGRSIADECA